MTYDTNPDIDDYFMRLGKTEARKMLGADAFPPYAMFGGIEYSLYCRAVETMVGWSIKHVMFANLLLEKRGYLKPRNLLTLLNPKEKIVAYLESALRVEQKTCHQIIDAVTLSLENAQEQFNGASRFVMPAYIAVNSVQMMCPIWGTHFNPYMFLLAELKRRHQKEWFDNVNLREEQFRRELYLLFPNDRFVTVDRNISIKEGKREITDIDAVIYDKQEKVLGIFQLKFQDLFGKSLRQRSNRKQGMLKANKWVINTLAWIEAHSIPELQEKLGFKGKDTEIEKIYLFVVGRYAAHFSGKETPDDKAAWGTWYQIQRIMSRFENHSVGLLHSILVQESPRVNEIELPNDLVIQIGTTSFFITHHRENDAG